MSRIISAALFYLFSILLIFFPFFFLGKTILSTDLYLMLYKPFAAHYSNFAPFNSFDDDILRLYYIYEWNAKAHPYQPYWISEIFGGIALYANTYATHFSPLNWVLQLGPLEFTYPLRTLCSTWIAGISMFALVSYFEISFYPSLLAGLGYMFSSLFTTTLLRSWILAPFAWVPLIFLFCYRALQKNERRASLYCALFMAFAFLDGFFQTSVSILLAFSCFSLFLAWKKNRFSGIYRASYWCIIIFLFAFILSAVMWLPQLEYFYWNQLKGASRVNIDTFHKNFIERLISLPLLVAAFFPQFLGSVRTLDLTKLVRSNLQDFSLFIGTLPFLLGLSTWSIRKESLIINCFWVVTLLGILIPTLSPLDRYLYFRFFAVYILGISVLAAFGLERALTKIARDKLQCIAKWAALLWSLILAASVILRIITLLLPGFVESKVVSYIAKHLDESTIASHQPEWMLKRAENFVHYWSLGSWEFAFPLIITGIAVAILYFWAIRRLKDRHFILLLFTTTLFQLGYFAHSWLPFHSLSKYPLFPDNEISDFLHKIDPQNLYRAHVDDFNRPTNQTLQIIPSNTNFFFHYKSLDGFDGIRPPTVADIPTHFDTQKLGDLNVKYIITNPEPNLSSSTLIVRHKESLAIYENLEVHPRGRVFYSYEIGDKGNLADQIANINPHKKSIILDKMPNLISSDRSPVDTTELIQDQGNEISYKVSTTHPGLFVSSESYYPGWKAYFNDMPVEILRANYVMRAVVVPAGDGILKFQFKPKSYTYGLALSVFGFILWLFLFVYFRLKNSKLAN